MTTQNPNQQTKTIIINSDDFGRSELNIKAIISAFQSKIVSSTSVFCTSPYFDLAANTLHNLPDLRAGVHLDFTFGKPVLESQKIPSLVDPGTGLFFPIREVSQRLAAGKIVPSEIALEFEAQINRMQRAGLSPSHLDNHRSEIYFYPDIFQVVLSLANKYQLPIRYPFGTQSQAMSLLSKRTNIPLNNLTQMHHKYLNAHLAKKPTPFPDALFLLPRPSENESIQPIISCLAEAPPGIYEICCHIDVDERGHHDYALLQSALWRRFVEANSIRHTSFDILRRRST